MTGWLSRQRKSDMIAIADEAGFKGYENLLKDELAAALDNHLRTNASTLSKKSSLKEFYERTNSPVKKDRPATTSAAATSEAEAKPRKKRTTKVKEEFDSIEQDSPDAKSLVHRTPKSVQRVAARVPLPSSPAVQAVSEAIDRKTIVLRNKVDTYWREAGLTERIEAARDALSSVASIEVIIILIESFALSKETLPLRYAFTFPEIKAIGTRGFDVSVPDFFQLVTAAFWAPTTLWTSTSLLMPLLSAYFFNLQLNSKRKTTYSVDPLTFNIVKALITYMVYGQGARFGGLINDESVAVINRGMYGGYSGVLIGAGIGVLASLYEAALRK